MMRVQSKNDIPHPTWHCGSAFEQCLQIRAIELVGEACNRVGIDLNPPESSQDLDHAVGCLRCISKHRRTAVLERNAPACGYAHAGSPGRRIARSSRQLRGEAESVGGSSS